MNIMLTRRTHPSVSYTWYESRSRHSRSKRGSTQPLTPIPTAAIPCPLSCRSLNPGAGAGPIPGEAAGVPGEEPPKQLAVFGRDAAADA